MRDPNRIQERRRTRVKNASTGIIVAEGGVEKPKGGPRKPSKDSREER